MNSSSPSAHAASASPNRSSGGRSDGESRSEIAASSSTPQQSLTSFTAAVGRGNGSSRGGGSGSGTSYPSVHPQRAWIEEMKNVVKACKKHEIVKVTRITPAFFYNG